MRSRARLTVVTTAASGTKTASVISGSIRSITTSAIATTTERPARSIQASIESTTSSTSSRKRLSAGRLGQGARRVPAQDPAQEVLAQQRHPRVEEAAPRERQAGPRRRAEQV